MSNVINSQITTSAKGMKIASEQSLLLAIGQMPLCTPHDISVDKHCEMYKTTKTEMKAILLNFQRIGYINIIMYIESRSLMKLYLQFKGYEAAIELSQKLGVRARK